MALNRKTIIDLLGSVLVAATLGCSLTMVLLGALSLTPPFGPVLFACAATALVAAAMVSGKLGAAVGAALAVVAGIVAARMGAFSHIGALVDALVHVGASGEVAIAEYALTAAILLGVLLTILLFWMARMSGGVYPALALSLILFMGSWFLSGSIAPRYAMMTVAALATMFARASDEKIPYVRAIPAAIIVAVLAIALLPGGRVTWAPLEQIAQKTRDLLSDYFFFTEPRTTYSISADGFQPMGELLGGPAEPRLDDVMVVKTDDTLLLRGSVKRTYTTYSWTETAVNSRYVYIDPTRQGLRAQVFDADRQPSMVATGAFGRVDADVTMISEGISALYVPHGMDSFDVPLDLVAYFSTSGEVFITRGVESGDHYALSAVLPTGNTAAMRALALERAGQGDDRYQAALDGYTALPQGIDRGVYDLALSITAGAGTPYDKALALENYLVTHYAYTLDAQYPPSGRDFVSHFLLDSKEGYCSYFATAMAVMGRMVGLPTRYIEGYMVPARADGTTVVTGKNAHAWVEVYLDGVGWVTFNPTPGSGDSYQAPRGDGAEGSGLTPDGGADDVDGDEGEDPADALPPPMEGDESGGEEQSTGEDESGDNDEHEPEASDEDEPEPEPDDQPDEQEPNEPDDDPPDDEPDLRFLWWLLLLIPVAGAAILAYRRMRATDPARMTGKRLRGDDKLMIWYRALLLALEYQGQAPQAGETPIQFAGRLQEAGLVDDSFMQVAKHVSLSRYAGRSATGDALKYASIAYNKLVRQLKPVEKARWLIHRLLKGLGDPLQIP